MSVLEDIRKLLGDNEVQFKELHHEPTPTSEDSARIRKQDIKTGGKALVLKIKDKLMLFCIRADLRLDSKKIKTHFSSRKVRFATHEELMGATGLVPGSVPPFGKPILDLDLYVDESIAENETIAFNAGSLTDSIVMNVKDYLKAAKPVEVFKFSS